MTAQTTTPELSGAELEKLHAYWWAGDSNIFLNPVFDGAFPPVLHPNGYKLNNPTLLSRISYEQKDKLRDMQIECSLYAYRHGADNPEFADWRWSPINGSGAGDE